MPLLASCFGFEACLPCYCFISWPYVQGHQFHLGLFPDPVSAAICYDREAAKAFGADGFLNFPPARIRSAASAGADSQSHVGVVRGRGQNVPAATKAPPPGDAADHLALVPLPKVSFQARETLFLCTLESMIVQQRLNCRGFQTVESRGWKYINARQQWG
jgi:hypothetical protein